jgi:predicted NodU family carbamoyl transferase
MNNNYYQLADLIPAHRYISTNHHESHAASTFYQSPYEEALTFSFDGGGNDGKFNIYHCTRNNGPILIDQIMNPTMVEDNVHYDLGFPYMVIGHFLGDINQINISW